jgi:hypothetical protein
MSMTGSRNVEVNGESLRSLDVAGGTSAEGSGRSRGIECRTRHRRGTKERRRRFNTSIFDHLIQRPFWQYLENASRKLINCRE